MLVNGHHAAQRIYRNEQDKEETPFLDAAYFLILATDLAIASILVQTFLSPIHSLNGERWWKLRRITRYLKLIPLPLLASFGIAQWLLGIWNNQVNSGALLVQTIGKDQVFQVEADLIYRRASLTYEVIYVLFLGSLIVAFGLLVTQQLKKV